MKSTPPLALSDLVLAGHLGILTLSVPVTFKYLDRTEALSRSLAGTEALLIRLRQILGEDLKGRMDSLLAPRPSLILTAGGEHYEEQPAKPTTEAYRDQLHEFVSGNAEVLIAYHRGVVARNGWTRWARLVSWASLALSAWEVLALFSLAFVLKVKNVTLSDGWLLASFVPTAVALLGVFAGLSLALAHHDTIIRLKSEHEPI